MGNLDYIAFINGMVQTLVGHPLDTLKTWRQTNIKSVVNIKSVYRGISYPLLTNSFVNHIQFNLINMDNNITINYLLTVMFTGTFLTPIEYYKIREQNKLKYNYPIGYKITITREFVGCITYFSILQNFQDFIGIKSDFITGGVAGSMSWLLCYPFDTIKTKIQSDIPLKEALARTIL